MKAILEFQLPEDKQDFELANSATKMYSTLWDFDIWLQTEIKYKDK